jgi:DNA primase
MSTQSAIKHANAQRFTEHEIAQLKASTDLLAIIRTRMDLKREGAEWVGLCPFHKETTPSFHVSPRKGLFHCFGCSASGDIFVWLKRTENLDFHAAIARLRNTPPPAGPRFTSVIGSAEEIRSKGTDLRKKLEKARRIWNEAVPAQGTLVERYLESRGLGGIMIPPTIRYHPRLWNQETDTEIPGMVAVVTDAKYQIIGIHRTYLHPDGRKKADVKIPKRMLGACRGSHVVLGLPLCGRLAIAEGIETSLSVIKARPDLGVWAALSLTNMDAPVPNSITELILCADGDNKDPTAADAVLQNAVLKHRQAHPSLRVRIARPDQGKDFNDMLMARRPNGFSLPDLAPGFLPNLQKPR